MRCIKEIDKDNNGYVTSTEMDDIMKLHYPSLKNKNLKKIMRPYASIQNRILIDYKKFRDYLVRLQKEYKEKRRSSSKSNAQFQSLTPIKEQAKRTSGNYGTQRLNQSAFAHGKGMLDQNELHKKGTER